MTEAAYYSSAISQVLSDKSAAVEPTARRYLCYDGLPDLFAMFTAAFPSLGLQGALDLFSRASSRACRRRRVID